MRSSIASARRSPHAKGRLLLVAHVVHSRVRIAARRIIARKPSGRLLLAAHGVRSATLPSKVCVRDLLDCCTSAVCAVHVTILGLLARSSDFYAERGSEVRAIQSADGQNPNFAPNIYNIGIAAQK